MRRFAALAVLLACRPPPAQGGTEGETTGPAGSTGADSTGTTDACMGSNDCETDGICVAGYQPGPEGPGGAREPAVCATPGACIEALDLGRWCFDHQGCCGDLRCRPADGVCEPPDLGIGTETGGDPDPTTGSTTGTTGSTGASTGGDTGTGATTDGSGTDTGEGTGEGTG